MFFRGFNLEAPGLVCSRQQSGLVNTIIFVCHKDKIFTFMKMLSVFIHTKFFFFLLKIFFKFLVHDACQAVNQLCSHFEAYRDIPKITELREKFKNIKQILKSHVFSDFSR